MKKINERYLPSNYETYGMPCHVYILRNIMGILGDSHSAYDPLLVEYIRNVVPALLQVGFDDDMVSTCLSMLSAECGVKQADAFSSWVHESTGNYVQDIISDGAVPCYKSCIDYRDNVCSKIASVCSLCPASREFRNRAFSEECLVIAYALSSEENLNYVLSKGVASSDFVSVIDLFEGLHYEKPLLISFCSMLFQAISDERISVPFCGGSDLYKVLHSELKRFHKIEFKLRKVVAEMGGVVHDSTLDVLFKICFSNRYEITQEDADRAIHVVLHKPSPEEVLQDQGQPDGFVFSNHSNLGASQLGKCNRDGSSESQDKSDVSIDVGMHTPTDEELKKMSSVDYFKYLESLASGEVEELEDCFEEDAKNEEDPLNDSPSLSEGEDSPDASDDTSSGSSSETDEDCADGTAGSETGLGCEDEEMDYSDSSPDDTSFASEPDSKEAKDSSDEDPPLSDGSYSEGTATDDSVEDSDAASESVLGGSGSVILKKKDYAAPTAYSMPAAGSGLFYPTKGSVLSLPVSPIDEIGSIAICLDHDYLALKQFEQKTLKDKQLAVELVLSSDSPLLLFYAPGLRQFFYSTLCSVGANRVIFSLLRYRSVVKVCFSPHYLISSLHKLGEKVRNVECLSNMAATLLPYPGKSMNAVLRNLGTRHAVVGVDLRGLSGEKIETECPALLYMGGYMSTYWSTRRKLLRSGRYQLYERLNKFDCSLALSFDQSVLSNSHASLYAMTRFGSYQFTHTIPESYVLPGKVVKITFDRTPRGAFGIISYLLTNLYDRGILDKHVFQIVSIGKNYVCYFLPAASAEAVSQRIEGILVRYMRENGWHGLETHQETL